MRKRTVVATLIYTETSKYLLDRANMLVTRIPGEGQGSVDGSEVLCHDLRKDNTAIKVHEFEEPEVGTPLIMLLQVQDDENVVTIRRTTIVRSIVELN